MVSARCGGHGQHQDTKLVTSGRKLPPVVPSVESAGCSTLSMRVMRATPAALMSCGTALDYGLSDERRTWLRLSTWVQVHVMTSVCVQHARHGRYLCT